MRLRGDRFLRSSRNRKFKATNPDGPLGDRTLLFGMSGVTAHDARYASLKRNERAQSTNGFSTQGSVRARAAPKSKRVKFLLAGSSSLRSLLCGCWRLAKAPAFTVPPKPGFGA